MRVCEKYVCQYLHRGGRGLKGLTVVVLMCAAGKDFNTQQQGTAMPAVREICVCLVGQVRVRNYLFLLLLNIVEHSIACFLPRRHQLIILFGFNNCFFTGF